MPSTGNLYLFSYVVEHRNVVARGDVAVFVVAGAAVPTIGVALVLFSAVAEISVD